MGSFSKLISDMVLFWNLFLHGAVFNVSCMEIAEAIGDFGQALTHGTGLASVTSDLRCTGLTSLTDELSQGRSSMQSRVAGTRCRRSSFFRLEQPMELANCTVVGIASTTGELPLEQSLPMARSSALNRHSPSTFAVRFLKITQFF